MHSFQFYECDNPECKLRFPGGVNQPRWNRCPRCRSTIHLVAEVNPITEQANPVAGYPWLVEALLDNIRSAWNVGAIFRTADGIGIQKLYLGGITPTPDNPKVRKTALGAEQSIAWEATNNGFLLAHQLKEKGYQLWALEDVAGAQAIFDVRIEQSSSTIILIVGNELTGIDPGILELCDRVIAIPMVGYKRSYNVAVAFGIAASILLYRQIDSQGSRKIFPST